ncbi:MAG: hypothetical protein IKP15_05505 [Bacteroidales bacterium]|nr:hypothetical protein [Bacteroidales bacterium]
MIIAVDFDGTIVENKYPDVGKERPFAIQTLRTLQQEGNRLILFTSREGEELDAAVKYCHDRGLDFYAVNSNQPDDALFKHHTAKVIADLYIDDRNLGGIPDWPTIYEVITRQRLERRARREKKRGWGLFRKK